MITSLRLHGQREALPVQPTTVTYADHQLAIQELTKAYEAKLAAAGGHGGSAPTESDMTEAVARIGELETLLAAAHEESETDKAKLAELLSQLEASSARLIELEALLDSVTSAPAPGAKVEAETPQPEAPASEPAQPEAPEQPEAPPSTESIAPEKASEKAPSKDEAKRTKR